MRSRTWKGDNSVKRGGSPSSAGSVLEALLGDTGLGIALREWEAVESWERIAGDRIARVTECERAEKGTLYVKVTSAPWRQELSYLKDALKEAVVRETGCGTIKDIVFY